MGNGCLLPCARRQGGSDVARARAAGDFVKSQRFPPVLVCSAAAVVPILHRSKTGDKNIDEYDDDRIATNQDHDTTFLIPTSTSLSSSSTSRLLESEWWPNFDPMMGANYVNYVPILRCSYEGNVKVWWFPADFCQSRLGDRLIGGSGSNACTIITLLMAHKIHSLSIQIWGHEDQPLNRQLMNAFAEAIVDGNEIHERLMASGPLRNPNLTLPEAMDACKHRFSNLVEWDSTVYHSKMRATLFDNLERGIMKWELQGMPCAPGCDLYIVLIADQRSVLLVFQRLLNRVTLIDSHSHLQHGAVVAQAHIERLRELCTWYDDMCWRFYESRPCCYELSYLYFQNSAIPNYYYHRTTPHVAPHSQPYYRSIVTRR